MCEVWESCSLVLKPLYWKAANGLLADYGGGVFLISQAGGKFLLRESNRYAEAVAPGDDIVGTFDSQEDAMEHARLLYEQWAVQTILTPAPIETQELEWFDNGGCLSARCAHGEYQIEFNYTTECFDVTYYPDDYIFAPVECHGFEVLDSAKVDCAWHSRNLS